MMFKTTFKLTFLLLAVVASFSTTAAQENPEDASVRLKGLDGKTYDTREMKGDVVVVSFGATWCVPCAWELAAIEELKVEYEGKPVRFLWVSIEDEARASNALLKHYAKTQRLTIPVLRDGDRQAFRQFSSSVRVPLVVFFDREGRFNAPAHRGMSPDAIEYKQFVRGRVDALLKATPGGSTGTSATRELRPVGRTP